MRNLPKRFTLEDLEQQTIDYLMELLAMRELPPKDAVTLLSVLKKTASKEADVVIEKAENHGPEVTIAYHPPLPEPSTISIVPYYPG